ncbi:adenylate kinase [Cryptococcus neoformans C23]|uniref:Adenylate kinase n=2 Tax=Cryptococcus neoformans TaxID=5207 RepID=A0A854QJH7_CRYNE|nr:adenylate kinase [Cryptococcus neoformans var. grubii H99]AUB25027.1 adenylate kinase [Cryptococcus neoformans var. grubii]OWZ31847.1 adenylate kinase [Cryptococcus neoformans var. grubii AD2-60a]OWZ43077.1 adenylate kinase [Cryptococcus neoformans var. grubii AD1-83a]OWZ43922.1 adenylate kinase [Cryptococcus neoformans var. grubii C23]OWZ54661.1 adenylate kinase [Cryptococcus neoformans var. grubii 125.91]OXC84655.1 adenylate kinase [Cryptococcus neoformans var. grubii AD1-7a]OXG21335.1 |eukprot:XP_012049141.1 adenylate kinase [Cryptococcus neoformans var. grubii H99]
MSLLVRPRTIPRVAPTLAPQRASKRFNSSSTASTSSPVSHVASAVTDTAHSLADKFREAARFINSPSYDGMEEKGLRMLVFGKPGSGKGTLSSRLVKEYDISFVSTGDVLRKEIAAKSEVGRKAEAVVASGGLVSDELMLEIVKAELDRLKGKSWIVDGFPRTLHQGELIDTVLNQENRPLNMVVHLNVPDSVIMARIAARWVHLPSGRVYNTTYSAPKVPGKDDVTGEPLTKRPDDTPETFSKRLQAYYESTAPLLKYFEEMYPESLHSISGSSSDEVSIEGGRLHDGAVPTTSSPFSSDQGSDVMVSASVSTTSSTSSSSTTTTTTTSSPSDTPQSTNPTNPTDSTKTTTNAALDQLWPQLVELIEPFNLRRRQTPAEKGRVDAERVRKQADDLRDSREVDVPGEGKKVVAR